MSISLSAFHDLIEQGSYMQGVVRVRVLLKSAVNLKLQMQFMQHALTSIRNIKPLQTQ